MVIQEPNLILFEADAFLDSDGDLRLKLIYKDITNDNQTVITTGKIKITETPLHFCNEQEEIKLNVSILPDKLNNLLTMETYE